MIPKERKAPAKDIKNPIEKIFPLKRLHKITRNKLTITASIIPSSYNTMMITILARPSLIPGIPMEGMKDSKIDKTIVKDVKTPNRAILLTFILNTYISLRRTFDNNNNFVIGTDNWMATILNISHSDTILMRTIR